MFNDRYSAGLYGRAVFDPSGGLITAGMMLAGTALSAGGTLAAGSAAKQAGQMTQAAANFQASQIRTNAAQALASSQRTAIDTQNKTNLAISSSTADAAANGVNAGTGSAVTNVGELAKRGSFQAAMDIFNGKSAMTGMLNEAAGVTYGGDAAALEGEEKESASYLAAGGTVASGIGSSFTAYQKMQNPTATGTAGASL
jgi:hypothetical protein